MLAEAAGVKLGDILDIRDSNDTGYYANESFALTEEDAGGKDTKVLASQQSVNAVITITYALSD